MKTKVFFTLIATMLLLLLPAGDILASSSALKTKKVQQQVTTIRGRVVDAESNQPLIFASIALQGTTSQPFQTLTVNSLSR